MATDLTPPITLIDAALLDAVSAEAQAGARGRKNRNFHGGDGDPAHRLLNAIEPGSYVLPHRHLDMHKAESMLVLRGRLGLVIFGDAGTVLRTATLGAGGEALGVDIACGIWHSVLALETGTVFFEAKAGPYRPLSAAERAPWAPAEAAAAAVAYQRRLADLFA